MRKFLITGRFDRRLSCFKLDVDFESWRLTQWPHDQINKEPENFETSDRSKRQSNSKRCRKKTSSEGQKGGGVRRGGGNRIVK